MNYLKKTGKLMATACMIAGLPLVSGAASASKLQTHIMSVQMESASLKELFELIEQKFDYTFLIRNNDIDLNERVSLDMRNRSVEEILRIALKNQHADFIVNDNRIVVYKVNSKPESIKSFEKKFTQQEIKITCTVYEAVT